MGDYSFSWNKYGAYSLGLDSDAQNCSISYEQEIIFSSFAKKALKKLETLQNNELDIIVSSGWRCIRDHYG